MYNILCFLAVIQCLLALIVAGTDNTADTVALLIIAVMFGGLAIFLLAVKKAQ